MKKGRVCLAGVLSVGLLLTSCATGAASEVGSAGEITAAEEPYREEEVYLEDSVSEEMVLEEQTLPLVAAPAVNTLLLPEASGQVVYGNNAVAMDASHLSDGYVMMRYTGKTTAQIKVLITGPSGVRYTYNLTADGQYITYPLSDGNGTYTIGVYRQNGAGKYYTQFSKQVAVTLTDEFAPFLRPNQYVNYTANSQCVAKAAQLAAGKTTDLERIQEIYHFVIQNLQYDYARAKTVQSGYIPNLDQVMTEKKGICFDYAALLTGMLRSQNIPTKMVFGYTGTTYHAWINVYTKEHGWMDGIIYFNGSVWKLMDPTFASTQKSSWRILSYIEDNGHYSAKYLY